MASSKIYDIAFRLNGKLNSSYNSTFARAESIAESSTRKIKNVILGLGSMVISTAAIKDFVDTYKEYQQEIYNVAATSGIDIGSEDYERLNEAALAAGKATTKTATEAAQALNYMALAGWSVEDSIKGLMPILRLSEATQADLATTSDLVTDSMAAMGLGVEDMTKYLDMAEMANNKSNQTALEMMTAVIKTGGIAKTLGIDMYDLGTALGILADNGVKAEEAGTAMNSILVRISSNESAISAMEKLGISAYDAQGNFRNLEDILIDINNATKGMSDDEKMLYLTDISGTRYASKVMYLLDSVEAGANGAASAWEELNGNLHNSEGALDRAADKMNSSLSARLKLLQSAWDDFKINVVSEAEPVLSGWVSSLADKLPSMTESTVQFINGFSETSGNLWDKGKALFEWAVKNKDTLGAVFAGIGSAMVIFKGAKGLNNTANGILAVIDAVKGIKSARNLAGIGEVIASIGAVALSHPVIAGLTLAAGAIGGIAYAVHKANKELAEASLAEHFGDIALSMSEVRDLADSMFTGRGFTVIQDVADALDEANEKFEEFQRTGKELDKLNFKVKVGLQLTETEIESYKGLIEDFVEQAQSVIDQQHYAVSLSVKEFVAEDSNIAERLNQFYINTDSEVSKLGQELASKVNDAFADNVLDPKEALDIEQTKNRINEIITELNAIDFESQMEALAMRLSGKELTPETYENLISEGMLRAEEYEDNAQQALAQQLNAYKIMLKKGDITYSSYVAEVEQLKSGYLNDVNFAKAQVYELANNTLKDTGILSDMHNFAFSLNLSEEGSILTAVEGLENYLNKELTGDFREAYAQAFDKDLLISFAGQAEKYIEEGKSIPQNILEGIRIQIENGTIAGDVETMTWYLYARTHGYNALLEDKYITEGQNIPDKLAQGVENGAPDAASRIQSATGEIINPIQAYLNNHPLTIKFNTNLSRIKESLSLSNKGSAGNTESVFGKLAGFARGTNYTPDTFIAGERGPELITDSKGYRVYDALETGNIYDNAARLWELITDRGEESRSLAVSRQISKEGVSSNTEINFSFTMPAITINGNVDDNTQQQFKAMLDQYKLEIERAVMQKLEYEADRKRRVSNE